VVSTTPTGQLPVTGSDPSVIIGVAGLCLLVGGALIAMGRSPKRT
jgi:LPXTG-motif cell wall-anchored protein